MMSVMAVKNPSITMFAAILLPRSSAILVAGIAYTLHPAGAASGFTRSSSIMSVPLRLMSDPNLSYASWDIATTVSGVVRYG